MLLSCFLRLINKIIPKNSRKIVFSSVPDYLGNARVFYQYLIQQNCSFRLIWLVDKIDSGCEHKCAFYAKRSLRGLYHFFTSRYIITNHSVFASLKCSAQFLIDLWHGMPLKKSGFFDSNQSPYIRRQARIRARTVDFTIATSELYRAILSASFQIDPKKIFVTGQPRNDSLFTADRNNILELFGRDVRRNFRHIVMYVPTFRQADGRTEGLQRDNIFGFSDFDKELLCEVLSQNDILLLIKFHPFEEKRHFGAGQKWPANIRFVTGNFLRDNNLDLHYILGGVDLLVTDYSSLYYDFLLLDRPIIFAIPDVKKYSEERGVLLEPLEFWMPGPKVLTFKELSVEMINCLKSPASFSAQRKNVNQLVNKYKDDRSCERVWKAIKKVTADV